MGLDEACLIELTFKLKLKNEYVYLGVGEFRGLSLSEKEYYVWIFID